MSREWQPGDVVAGLLDGNEIIGIVRGGGRRMFYADSVTSDQVDLKHVRNLRRLLVIDPEDRDQVRRLVCHKAFLGEKATVGDADDMQEALRELAAATLKIEEPTRLGAVVENEDGVTFVRTHVGRVPRPWTESLNGNVWYWEAIRAVRVLSEGVTP